MHCRVLIFKTGLNLLVQNTNDSSIDDKISQFNEILKSVAELNLVVKRSKTRKKTKKKTKKNHGMITLADKKKLQKLANKMNPTTPQSLRQEHFVLKKLANKTYKRYKNQLEFQPKRRILETNKQNSKK